MCVHRYIMYMNKVVDDVLYSTATVGLVAFNVDWIIAVI